MKLKLDWSVGYAKNKYDSPKKRVEATVPGAVQLDWAKAQGWGDYNYNNNWKQYLWMEDVYWCYSTTLDFPQLDENEKIYFVSKGIDYEFEIRLNGEKIYYQEGMFTPVEIDLTNKASPGDELEILVFPVPKIEGAKMRDEAAQCCKPACSYGWDWHPRLVPLGIWDETYLEIRPECHIQDAEVSYSLNQNLSKTAMKLDVNLNKASKDKLLWQFFDKNRNLIFEEKFPIKSEEMGFKAVLENPELWWPHNQGEPVLYLSQVKLIDQNGNVKDVKKSKVGFRRVRLVMYPGGWWDPDPNDFPKGRSNPPITMEINGRRIFCKGSNWVHPEIFPGIITEDRYRSLIDLAKEANMNMIRSWGGGIVNKESFFEICDEEGIMVWQDFPLACNNYVGTKNYLEVLDQESRSIIKRLRQHPSVVLWCGGNELFNEWSRMTEQSWALRLLDQNCYQLDPKTPFIMTSPIMGMAHGNYMFVDYYGREVFQYMREADNTAYTEFGCPGPASIETLKSFIPKEDLFPPTSKTAWQSHSGFFAWEQGGDSTWLMPEVIENYFGKVNSLEELVEGGETLQSEGLKCIFEEARRQQPRCSMAISWTLNEPWPTAANNSIISWPDKPKPAYYAVKKSCRPVLASAQINKFSWKEGEVFNPQLWVLNDSPEEFASGIIKAFLKFGEEKILIGEWNYGKIEANKNLPGPQLTYVLPKKDTDLMTLVLKVKEHPEMNSEYELVYRSKNEKDLINEFRAYKCL